MRNFIRINVVLLIIFLTFSSCNSSQPNYFEEMLVDYNTDYKEEWVKSHLESINEKSKTRINKLESIEDLTIEFSHVLEEWKFIYSACLELEGRENTEKIKIERLAINASILDEHWENLMDISKRRYRSCDSFWKESNIHNFKELLYNQIVFKKKAINTIEQLTNYNISFDDIDCDNGLSDIDINNFKERFDKDLWVVTTNF